jgi:two-component system nitrate/nitrite response regulator NarL
MCLASAGLSNKEIGRRLNISDGTIKVHLHHIYEKLQVSNRTVLAALAISQAALAISQKETSSPPTENQVPRIPKRTLATFQHGEMVKKRDLFP